MAKKKTNGAAAASAPVFGASGFGGQATTGSGSAVTGKVATGTAAKVSPAVATATTAATSPITAAVTPAPKVDLKSQYQRRQAESANRINDLYDKQYQTKALGLKSTFDRNLSDRQAALDAISPQYQTAANDLAINLERQRRNASLNAMNNGMATGTQVQQQNAFGNKWLDTYGRLRKEEAGAIDTANRDIANLRSEYNDALVNARAETDTKRDQAIIEAANKDREWYENQAKALAQSGNFDAYKDIYGSAQAKTMQNAWIAQNPDLAYRMGTISAKQYKKLTGKDPNTK